MAKINCLLQFFERERSQNSLKIFSSTPSIPGLPLYIKLVKIKDGLLQRQNTTHVLCNKEKQTGSIAINTFPRTSWRLAVPMSGRAIYHPTDG